MHARLIAATAAALFATTATAQPASTTAELKNSTGQTVGTIYFTAAPKGVVMRVEVKGLSPGWHGLHLHEKGDCSKSDYTSAGGHVHGPATAVHGLLNPKANEPGDLPNIHAGTDGESKAEVYTAAVTLAALKDADGSAVIIHANPDDHMTQPIGGAGPRVACAVVK